MPWAGRHLLFCGDWLQIPPVLGRPCFAPPTNRQALAARQGYNVYRSINFVVYLTQNMRNRDDSEYTGILSRLRWGRTTDEDISILNAQVNKPLLRATPSPWIFHPIIVPTNQQRCAINHRMTYESASSSTTRIYECMAVPTSSRSVPTFERTKHLDDSCTQRIPFKLLYFIGMPVMLSQRSKPFESATANGTIGFIAGHELAAEEQLQQREERHDCEVIILQHMPRRLILRLPGQSTQFDPALPVGHLYIEPVKTSVEIQVPRAPTTTSFAKKRGREPTLTATIRQFAVVPAFACTPEKLQGLTCHDGITLVKLQRPNIPPQSLYVALSRTTTLANLVLTHTITWDYIHKFKPDKATAAEIARLLTQLHLPTYVDEENTNTIAAWVATQKTP